MPTRNRTMTRRRSGTSAKRRTGIMSRRRRPVRLLKFAVPLMFIIAITFGLGFMVLAGYQTAVASSFFGIRNVEINGIKRAPKNEIENIVRQMSEKTGVWRADLASIKRDVEELTFVKTAVVSRVLPDGMRVNIVERVPRAVVSMQSGEFWVDDEAVILSKFDKNTEALPFLLKGWDERKTLNAVGENKERVKIYIRMLQEWQEFDLVKRVIEVDLRDLQEAKVVVKDSGELVVITVGKDNYGKGMRSALKAIANKGDEIKAFNVQTSVSQQREKSN